MLDGDVVELAKGCLASSENDPARELVKINISYIGQAYHDAMVQWTIIELHIPLLIKCHTPRAMTTAIAMTFMEERQVIKRAAHLTLYAFTKVKQSCSRDKY